MATAVQSNLTPGRAVVVLATASKAVTETVGHASSEADAVVMVDSSGNVTSNCVGYTDSVAALGAAAVFTGAGRPNTNTGACFFGASAYSDQAGTLYIDQSVDTGATYQPVAAQAITAGAAVDLSLRLRGANTAATLYRVRYVNGSTAQGAFRLSSSFTLN